MIPARLLAVLLALGVPAGARADVPFAQAQASLQSALAPSRTEVVGARARALEAATERLVLALPGVLAARAQATLVDPAYLPLDEALPKPLLSLVVTTQGVAPSDAQIQQLLGPMLRLQGVQLRLFRAKPSFFSTSPKAPVDSREDVLKPVLALSLVANVLLATLLIIRIRRGAW
jgi:hypothetical protein